jgi:Domain of unknown function (DUF4263)
MNMESIPEPPEVYTIVRTSRDSADAEPVVIRDTNTTRLIFKPTIVNNARDSRAPVQGSFIFQKKGRNDRWEDHNELLLSHLRASEWVKLDLKAGEVHKLLGHIAGLYRQYKREGLPRGKTHFLKIDTAAPDGKDFSSADLSRLLETMGRAGVDVATRVFEWMASTENASDILDQLGRLQASSLQQISSLVGITNLRMLCQLWEENQSNKNEEFWQKTFQKHSFALTQLFAFPVILFRGKAYVGGKGLENTGGNIVDFLAANHLTHNALLIEIKTPLTPLLGGEYRGGGIYSASDDFSGAISQVLNYRHSLQREFDSLGRDYRDRVDAFSPQCMVVMGNTKQLSDPGQVRSFELLRDAVRNEVTVVTYDELFGKVKALLDLLEGRFDGALWSA